MPRVIVAEGCREIDSPATGQRYYARGGRKGYMQGGAFDMPDSDAKLAVAMGGAVASLAGTARRSTGYRCGQCGFGSYTRRCSRCGNEECERE